MDKLFESFLPIIINLTIEWFC